MCDASVLQALLLATLERLEGVEAVVAAADATSAAMEEKVRILSMCLLSDTCAADGCMLPGALCA
jgi:hypothetical protein